MLSIPHSFERNFMPKTNTAKPYAFSGIIYRKVKRQTDLSSKELLFYTFPP